MFFSVLGRLASQGIGWTLEKRSMGILQYVLRLKSRGATALQR